MSEILEKATSPEVMNLAWRRHRNDKADWAPDLPKSEMATNVVYHLLRLAEELRSGAYRPHPVRFFTVNKGDGKKRVISAVTLRDKVAQRAVLTVLTPLGEKYFHHCSYAYRPGRNIDMAVAKAREYVFCGMPWLVDADIKKYFDNISHPLLLKKLRDWIGDKKTVALVRRWLDAGIPRKGFLSASRGIPQGGVVSPWLCNVYLTDFDRQVAGVNLPMVRFADDFLVFARSRDDGRKALEYIKKSLAKLELEVHPDKTRVVESGPGVVFLGRKMPRPPRDPVV